MKKIMLAVLLIGLFLLTLNVLKEQKEELNLSKLAVEVARLELERTKSQGGQKNIIKNTEEFISKFTPPRITWEVTFKK